MRFCCSHFVPSVPNARFLHVPSNWTDCVSAPNSEWVSVKLNELASALGLRGFLWLRASHKSFRLHFLFAILHIAQHWSHTCIQLQFDFILEHAGTCVCMQRLWAKSAKREETKDRKGSKRSKKIKNIKQDSKKTLNKGQSERLQVDRPGAQTAYTLLCASRFGRCYAPIPSTSAVWSLGEVNPGCKR